MTKKQEEAIKNLTSLFDRKARMVQEAKINNAMTNFKIELKKEVSDWETVLNMLKEKDAEIDDLKQTLARNIAKNFTSSMKESAKSKEDLEMLNKGWQIELEKKDKQINLIINAVYKRFKAELLLEYGFENEEQFKQYFERKSEE